MPILKIPILDRLSFRDYQSLFITVIFFTCESLIRIIVMLMPKFLVKQISAFVESQIRWFSNTQAKPHVSSLEKAETFEKMVKHWGNYDCEQHIVPTKDDYFLCVHRIPSMKDHHKKAERYDFREKVETRNNMDHFVFDKNPKPFGYTGKPVVLLYHGFLMSSEVWVSNIEEHSNLPFVLAQQGYDVWLGNARGNKYSQYHLHLNPEDPKFWNFSMNEFAMRDLPDTVDYILEQTGAPNLTYIGFSQGTAQAFASLSVNPSLNKKVNLFIALAPATTPKGLRHPIIDAFVKATPNVIYLVFGRKAALKLALFWQRIISPPLFAKVIDSCCYFLFGWTGNNIAPAQKAVSYQHLYSTTSVKSLVHWFQIIRCGKFQMYDEVPSRLPYHTMNAVAGHLRPRFPTLQIKTPIAIFYGRSDSLVDFNILSADLPSPLAYVKSIEKWEHLDFLWADKIETLVYQDILKLLEKFNPHLNSPVSQKEGIKNNDDSLASSAAE